MMDLDGTQEQGGPMTLTPLGLSASHLSSGLPLAVSWHTTLTGVGNPQPL